MSNEEDGHLTDFRKKIMSFSSKVMDRGSKLSVDSRVLYSITKPLRINLVALFCTFGNVKCMFLMFRVNVFITYLVRHQVFRDVITVANPGYVHVGSVGLPFTLREFLTPYDATPASSGNPKPKKYLAPCLPKIVKKYNVYNPVQWIEP